MARPMAAAVRRLRCQAAWRGCHCHFGYEFSPLVARLGTLMVFMVLSGAKPPMSKVAVSCDAHSIPHDVLLLDLNLNGLRGW